MAPLSTTLTPAQDDVLHLLVTGGTRHKIARMLHIGVRTVDTRLAELRQLLGTSQRLCLGVRAVRSGWVDPQHPVSTALARRPGNGWTQPSQRQRDLVCLLSEGITVAEAAEKLCVSHRSARGDLVGLTTANGALGLVHTGALSEALNWTRPICRESPPRTISHLARTR